MCTLTIRRLALKIGKAFSASLHLWFCIRIPITIVLGLTNLFQNTGDPTIILLVQVNNMIAHFTILFVLIVLGKFVQTPQVLCDRQRSRRYGKKTTIIINTVSQSGIEHPQFLMYALNPKRQSISLSLLHTMTCTFVM